MAVWLFLERQGARTLRWSQGHYGKFSRTLKLPFGIRPDDVKAKMDISVLTITSPKVTTSQQLHWIAFQ
ncbi:hypothetical protein PAXRUDRAFT_835062 [Paxillus rubicundulus Ve08.2h10]|uniref:SHSP domain-containing protein n=1 Tax=Paxillus rubicundulus Ve08.2h10 TaxID=930991 RepID=A0A0D0D0Y3_9AGAM|nr:hypothetical protein PAXRUDRAFT_835062 [Paxillus rubicundulus Ve08.2h10]